MKRRQPTKSRSAKPAIAALAISAAIAAVSLWPGGDGEETGSSGPADVDLPVLVDGDSAAGAVAPAWQDLLRNHGSWDPRGEVRCAFSIFDLPTSWAAPAGEVGSPAGRWPGGDPPQLRLGVVLISEHSRRAVLDGRVVGVGDAVQTARITGIERGTVTVTWSGRRLTYDLDGPAPREFRAELAARAADRQEGGSRLDDGAPAANGAQSDESVQKETNK